MIAVGPKPTLVGRGSSPRSSEAFGANLVGRYALGVTAGFIRSLKTEQYSKRISLWVSDVLDNVKLTMSFGSRDFVQ
jgi:hypothetical protein